MSTLNENLPSSEEIRLTEEIRDYMLTTAKWARFLGILGFVGVGFFVLCGIYLLVGGSFFTRSLNVGMPFASIGFIYFLIAIFYFFPVYYLYKAATKWRNGLINGDNSDLTEGFRYFKSHYKFIGILALIVVSIQALIFMIGLISYS
jgi:hypothetical protein